MAANRVVVLLSDEELAEVQGKAGLVPLSAWFRALALGKKPSKQAIQVEQIRASDPMAAERPEMDYAAHSEVPSGGSVSKVGAAVPVNPSGVRPHTMHSGIRPVPGCKQCEEMK
jgi:hypothetical protein